MGLAKGRDATVLFESYHSLALRKTNGGAKFAAVLEKYAVTDPAEIGQLHKKYGRNVQGMPRFEFAGGAAISSVSRLPGSDDP